MLCLMVLLLLLAGETGAVTLSLQSTDSASVTLLSSSPTPSETGEVICYKGELSSCVNQER